MFNKQMLIWGGIFGLIAPFVGMFIGLQLSVMLANVLMFPIIALSALTNKPIGTWDILLILMGIILSILCWALIFGVVAKLLKKLR